MIDAECTGQMDEKVHGPQQLVLRYLDLLDTGAFDRAQDLISSRWRSAPDFKQYEQKLPDLDLSAYRLFGKVRGGCLDVVKVERPNRTVMQASVDCYLELGDQPVDVSFDVVRNLRTKKWMIHGVRIERCQARRR